ncbi:MAG: MerR family transcriptional regulator [Nannocystaceae bacterium]
MSKEREESVDEREQGRYRIQSVAEITGVSAATLRAWERRYGIPRPRRTASAYRLYSERDVELIKRVRELCDAGMAPSQAAQLVLSSSAEPEVVVPVEVEPSPDTSVYALAVRQLLDAVDRFDAERLESAVKHALYLGPGVTVFDRVLAPTLTAIGLRWEEGTLSVGQEHLAAECLGNAVRHVLRLAQPEQASRQALLACFADEEHTTPLYGIALRFAEWGFRTVILGARTPTHALRHAVAELNPDIVGLSVTIAPPPYRARELVDGYADACGDAPWIIGGAGAADLADLAIARGGVVATDNRGHLRELLDRLVNVRRESSRH